jgi:CDP-glucose 4,6-dehydratase
VTRGFWQGKRVLLTGHTGFKGSWISLWLQRLGAEVTGYALEPPTQPSLFAVANVGAGMRSVLGDLRDLDALHSCLRETRPEIVLHLAAQALVRPSYDRPVETYATNVMGTVHVLEAVRKSDSIRAVLVVTSDKCYENRERREGYRESDPMGGFDPYSSSKGCAELVTAAYRNSFFAHGRPAVATARAGNVIGGGDWATDRLVPDFVRTLSTGDPVVLRNPTAVRPWQHVLDPLAGYLTIIERLWHDGASSAEPWNFGPDEHDARPVKWLVERMGELWGGAPGWRHAEGTAPHESEKLRLDSSKARARLCWAPRLDLETALAWTIDWHRAHQRREDMREHTIARIRRYEEIVTA